MKSILRHLFPVVLAALLLPAGCSDDAKIVTVEPEREPSLVTVLVDDRYTVAYGGTFTVRGLGFEATDEMLLREGGREAAAAAEEVPLRVERVTSAAIELRIPESLVSGVWSLYCRRAGDLQWLGAPYLEVLDYVIAEQVSLDGAYTLDRGDRMRIAGVGFAEGDGIAFAAKGAAAADRLAAREVVAADDGIVFRLPDQLASGTYEVWALRGQHEQLLGESAFEIVPFEWIDPATLPEGTTLYGRVYAGDRPLAGVAVSDGLRIARTDERGVWSLASDREEGTVFVSLPSGYEAPLDGCVPRFWHLMADGRDRYDFPLAATGTDAYVLLVTADIQIDNLTRRMVPQTTLQSCNEVFVPDFRQTVDAFAGRKVYAVSLGDMVYDRYWYTQRFAFPEYIDLVSQFGVPFFHIMGNHDNDPWYTGDAAAEAAYKRHLGPTHYSMDLGDVHFIALDNVRYINSGASEGIVGDCSYASGITDRQMEWLRADLEALTDKTAPVIVWMHVPLTNGRLLEPTGNMSGHAAFASLFEGFSDVRVMSGHHHNNHHSAYPGTPHIEEHAVGSVCGSLWYNVAGHNGEGQLFGAATDGTPMGYAVYEIDGRDIRWRFKGCGIDDDVQFKVWDMNRLDDRFRDRTIENEILVNVWDWDEQWKVEVLENGAPIGVERQLRKDPDYMRYVEEVYLPSGDSPTKAAAKAQPTPHMFSAVTASADSPLTVRVTDRFDRVYEKQVR